MHIELKKLKTRKTFDLYIKKVNCLILIKVRCVHFININNCAFYILYTYHNKNINFLNTYILYEICNKKISLINVE